jgi:hypothetical protein
LDSHKGDVNKHERREDNSRNKRRIRS